eukprot:943186-Rhodomonas_salina.3
MPARSTDTRQHRPSQRAREHSGERYPGAGRRMGPCPGAGRRRGPCPEGTACGGDPAGTAAAAAACSGPRTWSPAAGRRSPRSPTGACRRAVSSGAARGGPPRAARAA